jgi:iron complex transport system ATP-binding protein
MIGLDHFSLSLNGKPVLRDVTFHPRPGELTALCGPNGAGKTSMLRALAGLVPNAVRPDPRKVAYLAQNPGAAWGLAVERIVALGRIPHGPRADDAAIVTKAMLRCGVEGLRHARIDRISGGEARRAMLARVFATEPETFLLDEPTADLDPAASHAILRLLRDVAEEGAAVVAVLHTAELAVDYAHRVILIDQGRVVADLPADRALDRAAALFGMRTVTGPRLVPPS